MKIDIKKLEEVDVEVVSREWTQAEIDELSAFLQKRKAQRAKRSAAAALKKASLSAKKPG